MITQKTTADITIKNHYTNFINSSKVELSRINKELERINKMIDIGHQYLTPRREEIRVQFGLTLDNYIEYNNKEINPISALLKKVNYIRARKVNDDNIGLSTSLYNYCQALEIKSSILERKRIIDKKVNLTFNEYQQYVFDFYSEVHKILLEGKGYIIKCVGTFHIDRYKVTKRPVRIDIAETSKNRRKLIEEGKIPYDPAMAKWCKEHNQEYNGVKFKVNKIVNHEYKIKLTDNPKNFVPKLAYININYINAKYKNLSYDEILDKYCKTLEDIYRLQVSLNVKLSLLLIKFPGYYVNFIRDVSKQ